MKIRSVTIQPFIEDGVKPSLRLTGISEKSARAIHEFLERLGITEYSVFVNYTNGCYRRYIVGNHLNFKRG